MPREPPLLQRFPALARALPRRPLVPAPTPVEALPAEVAGRGGCFVKRDDRASPVYGGNKVRRFEWLLADAEARGARTLVTVGGLASTQVLATAAFGRHVGLRVAAVLFDQRLTAFARRVLVTAHGLGAELVRGGGYAGTAARALALLARAERPYFLAPGASGPLGVLGYVDAALELAAQVEAGEAPRPDRVLVATGSGGTAAGLALGFALLGWDTEVVAVRITEPLACNALTLRFHAERAARLLRRLGVPAPPPGRISVEGRFLGAGYGEPTREARLGAAVVPRALGVQGEITYSGKAFAALRARAAEAPGETLLLWATLSSAPTGAVVDEADEARLCEPSPGAAPPGFERFFEARLAGAHGTGG